MTASYPFQTVLEIRQARADDAQRALADAQAELDELTALRRDILATWARIGRKLKEERDAIERGFEEDGGCASSLQLFEERARGLSEDEAIAVEHLRKLEQSLDQAHKVLEENRRVLNECLVQKRVLEQHRERWLKSLALKGERREERDQEVFASHKRTGNDRNGHD